MTNINIAFLSNSLNKRTMSKHAHKRGCQRGISELSLPLVLAFGEREFDGQGGIRYLMTANSVNSLRRVVGTTQQVEALAGVYAVLSTEDQTVITVGHRYSH